jgi:protein-disulfide isomerase
MNGSTGSSQRTLIIWIAIAALVLLTMIGGIVVAANLGLSALRANDTTQDKAGTGAPTTSTELVLPPDVTVDQAYIEFGPASGVPVVDVYADFLCPYGRLFAAANDADVRELAESGRATIRIHPRPMLDDYSEPAGYSGRSANAALAVYAEDPDLYWDMADALYANQPGEGGAGLTDEELIELAHSVGAGQDVDVVITEGRYIPWLEQVVEPEAQSKDIGTPTVYIDGTAFEGDQLYENGGLEDAVLAAA